MEAVSPTIINLIDIVTACLMMQGCEVNKK